MSGPGRRAVLPPAGYRKPSNLSADGLVVHVVGQGGADHGTFDFRDCAGPDSFRRELVAAFAFCASASGTWGSAVTCDGYAQRLRQFLSFAASASPPVTDAAKISPAVWNTWTLPKPRRRQLRVVLLEVASLPADTRARMQTQRIRGGPTTTQESYSLEEFKDIRAAADKAVSAALRRIETNTAVLERWRAGEIAQGCSEWWWGWLLDHLARTGCLPRATVSTTGVGYFSRRVRRMLGDGGGSEALARLYPTYEEMGAAAVLLICHEAWNLSVIKTMQVPEVWPNADSSSASPAIHRVEVDKPRRGPRLRHGSNNLVDVGEGSSGRAIRQVLAFTAQARATLAYLGAPSTSLLLARRSKALEGGRVFADGTAAEEAIKAWSDMVGLAGGDGAVKVGARRLRRSVQVLYGAPRNNSLRTHQDVYLLRDEQVREESGEVVAAGLAEAICHAEAAVRMRVVPEATGSGSYDAEQVAKQTGLADGTAVQVVQGQLDTAVAACTDFEHSPFTPSGPCAVSFLLCFACPNALATGRHLPRIVYLHQALETLRSAVETATWAADWAEHHSRVVDLLHAHTTEAERAGLRAQLTEPDRELIDGMLERRLDP